MKISHICSAVALCVGAASANAALLSIVGGAVMPIPTMAPNYNNFQGEGDLPAGQQYSVGGNLFANHNLYVDYYYLGHEATFNNNFVVGSETISTADQVSSLLCANHTCDSTKPKNASYLVPTINSMASAGAFLDFGFWTQVNASLMQSVTNGSNTSNQKKYDYAVALNTSFHMSPYDAIIFLDDTGKGANGIDDDNHDDMLIGVRVRAVPEPSALLLVGLGLLSLVGVRRLKA